MLNKILRYDKYIAIFSVLALFLILGGTFALTSWRTSNYNIALDSACLDVNYTKGQNINETVGSIDESTYLSGNTITMASGMAFTSVNIELDEDCYDINGLATIEINVTSLPNQFKSGGNAYGSLTYVVAEYDPTTYNNLTINNLTGHSFNVVARGTITNTGVIDAYTKYMEPGEIGNYLVIFYVNNPGVLITGSLGASIDTEVVQFVPTSIDNFEYSIGTFDNGRDIYAIPNGKVLLTWYNGSSTIVNVPSTYEIDGVEYDVAIFSNNCFNGNTSITEVNFANNLTLYSPGREELNANSAINLFSGCTSLVNAPTIPNSVTDMSYTFSGCTSLVNAPTIPNSVTSMSSTFSGCTSLVNAPTIPSSVTDMSSTFSGCTSLVNAPTIPNSVTSMSSTFSGCTSLVNAPTIPNSVTSMSSTFYGCTSLVNAPTIPNSVTSMSSTFYGCTSLVTAPTIPSSVTNMTSTFRGCTSLTGTVRINSSNVTRTSGTTYHPFYGTSSSNAITVEVPSGSTTYTNINNDKPSNVTVVTY